MNATNASQTSLQAEQKAHEPSMEDILASIRKIIADDDALPLSRRASLQPEPPPAAPAQAEQPAQQPVAAPSPPPVAVERSTPSPAMAAPARFQGRSESPLRPPPLPNLRELALRLDDIPGPLAPTTAAPPPDLRPSLDDHFAEGGDLPLESFTPAVEPPKAEARPEPAAAAIVTPDPAPQPAAPSVSFETGGMTMPPLSFRASVPPPIGLAPVRVVAAESAPVAAPGLVARISEASAAEAAKSAPVSPTPVSPSPLAPARSAAPPPARLDWVEPAMLSGPSEAKVGAAFEALAESALLRDPEMVERLTREILRPMIKTWLDDNLPNVVERLVRAEIERVARGPKG